ncbi:ATP-binding protein [Vibrio porteresiae]|uniref:histidine kinase n=1 Tax=Vibrio porteresiae DSM 19223 TaxID=1123496 RepID=A0ABZ0QKZ4_9VIBR|nr:ATP-binding protein [Vibrio porteresiae]WPC76081.1 ATP-binding protein [Vibrio porteresiae DSM 19223]
MSLRFKTIIGIAIIELISLSILLTLTLRYLTDTNYQGLEQRVESTINLYSSAIKNPVLSYDLATLNDYTETLMQNKDIEYVAVLNENGLVLATAGNYPKSFSRSMLESNVTDVKDSVYDVSAPLKEAGVYFGTIWMGFNMNALNEKINQAKHLSITIIITEISLVAIFSYILGDLLTKRLAHLNNAAKEVAQGNFDVSLKIDGSDEVSSLAHAFNEMITQLQASKEKNLTYQRQLEEINNSLEEKVNQRTSELLAVNSRLSQTNFALQETQHKLVETEKMASLGIMAAGFAHEINNPAGVISGNLNVCLSYLELYKELIQRQQALLQEHVSDDERQALTTWTNLNDIAFIDQDFPDSIHDAIKCVDRIHDIVQALQHYSTDRNDSRETLIPVDLFPSIDRALNQVYTDKSVHIVMSPNLQNLPRILGIPREIDRLCKEILKNAIQSCISSGRADKQVTITGEYNETSIVLKIKDNGLGIRDKDLKHVFDPFYTTLPVGQGMGLGLTYSYDIVRHVGGNIDINNSVNGVEVVITLPLI